MKGIKPKTAKNAPYAPSPSPTGVPMKLLAAATAGIITGATGALLAHRYAGALLWWIFTTDVRHTR